MQEAAKDLTQRHKTWPTNFPAFEWFLGHNEFPASWTDPPQGGEGPEVDNRIITPEYLHVMNIPLVLGRTFTEADRAGASPVAMINQTLAKQYFKDRDPGDLPSAEKLVKWLAFVRSPERAHRSIK